VGSFDFHAQRIRIDRGRHERRLFDLRTMGTGQPPLETVKIVDDDFVLRACEGVNGSPPLQPDLVRCPR